MQRSAAEIAALVLRPMHARSDIPLWGR